jgi:hypothetical protein
MGALLDRRMRTLLDAIAFAWPSAAFAWRMHTPQPIPPVDDEDEDDDDRRGGSSGGNIDPDDGDEGDDDDDEEDDETLWTRGARCAQLHRT